MVGRNSVAVVVFCPSPMEATRVSLALGPAYSKHISFCYECVKGIVCHEESGYLPSGKIFMAINLAKGQRIDLRDSEST